MKTPLKNDSADGFPFAQYYSDFSFQCHRRDLVPNLKDQSLIYAINDISYHPKGRIHSSQHLSIKYQCTPLLSPIRLLTPPSHPPPDHTSSQHHNYTTPAPLSNMPPSFPGLARMRKRRRKMCCCHLCGCSWVVEGPVAY